MIRLPAVVAVSVLAVACTVIEPQSPDVAASAGDAQRRILVTVPQRTFSAFALTGPPAKRYLRRRGYSATPVVDRVLDSLAKDHRIERIEGWPIRSLRVYCEVFRVPAGTGVDRVVANLAADPRVDLVERMSTFETLIGRYDDPYGDLQWSVPQLELEEAHLLATGRGVTVAVIDSDIDAAHPDLKDRVKLQRDLVGGGKNPHGGEIHGTAVAGIIASVVDNDEGIIGIAPDVSIAALRACWSETEQDPNAICSSFTLAKALEAAIQIAPQVINLSLAGPFDPLLSRLLDEAIGRGIKVVAAAPGSEDESRSFPASHSKVIVAYAASGWLSATSPYLLAAPGTEILTTTPHAGYAFLSGNSLAAAHVSGVIALLMERDPAMSADQVATLLAGTTTYSRGMSSIDACLALARLTESRACNARGGIVSF